MNLPLQVQKSRRGAIALAVLLTGNTILLAVCSTVDLKPSPETADMAKNSVLLGITGGTGPATEIAQAVVEEVTPAVSDTAIADPQHALAKGNNTEEPSAVQVMPVVPSDAIKVDAADHSQRTLLITNPKSTGGTIHFAVGEKVYSLQAGEKLELHGSSQWDITFHSGIGEQYLHQSFAAGKLHFQVDKRGWRLVSSGS